ncbi:hypothetical protein [Kitasatospora sp. CB01950]|uniref:hypothetical protein n=1 Tax=Kitasatospora sp. CB01950 TaxID=1703930 RepID=UPI0011613EF1
MVDTPIPDLLDPEEARTPPVAMKDCSGEFEADAVALYGSTPGAPYRDIAADPGINRAVLREWVLRDRARRGTAPADARTGGAARARAARAAPFADPGGPAPPEAVAFAGHCGFDVDVLAACRPQGKGRVERQVAVVRDHVLACRAFSSVEELGARPRPGCRCGVVGRRAVRDRMALRPLRRAPSSPGDTCGMSARTAWNALVALVALDTGLCSVPARRVRARRPVGVRVATSQVVLHAAVPDASGGTLPAHRPGAVGRGVRIIDERHRDGLPEGGARRVTTGDALPRPRQEPSPGEEAGPLRALPGPGPPRLMSRSAAGRLRSVAS